MNDETLDGPITSKGAVPAKPIRVKATHTKGQMKFVGIQLVEYRTVLPTIKQKQHGW